MKKKLSTALAAAILVSCMTPWISVSAAPEDDTTPPTETTAPETESPEASPEDTDETKSPEETDETEETGTPEENSGSEEEAAPGNTGDDETPDAPGEPGKTQEPASPDLGNTYTPDGIILTWDSNRVSLSELALLTGLDICDENEQYSPVNYSHAYHLWDMGLFFGSDGSFKLDYPLTRTEAVIMSLRLLGEDTQAEQVKIPCPFKDVPDWAKYSVGYAHAKGMINGYDADTFGANDPVTANQYITLVLRAMGYTDGVDFQWDTAANTARMLKMIDEKNQMQYMHSNLFFRDNAAYISYNALKFAEMKGGGLLIDTLTPPGKPDVEKPTAKGSTPYPIISPDISVKVSQQTDYITFPDEKYVGGELMKGMSIYSVILEVESGTGALRLDENINGVWSSRYIDVVEGQRYDITPSSALDYKVIVGGVTYNDLKVGRVYDPA